MSSLVFNLIDWIGEVIPAEGCFGYPVVVWRSYDSNAENAISA